jgi:diguanylate cyclase (GGDEF)-like protein
MFKVFDCLTRQHDYTYVAVAAIVCIAGCWITLSLYRRTRRSAAAQKIGWIILTAVAAGSAVWTTHFIAMLGFDPLVPYGYAPLLTLLSWFIAVAAACAAFWTAILPHRFAALLGGAIFGAGVGAMHYTGMSALLIPGVVHWDAVLITISIAMGMAFGAVALNLEPSTTGFKRDMAAIGLLSLSIVALHFTGMGAITIVPDPTIAVPPGLIEKGYLAFAIVAIMLIVVGTVMAAQLIDRHAEREALSHYRHLAMHDALTALPNRAFAGEVAADWINQAVASGNKVAIIAVDLDRFKDVNDVYGHTMGDALLKSLAQRLDGELTDNEFIARIGGDEFLAVKTIDEDGAADAFARKLITILSAPVHNANRVLSVGASCGLAIYPDDGRSADELILRADLAMYRAKRMKSDSVCRYHADEDEEARRRSELSIALQSAIANDELVLYYQPQIMVASGIVSGFEALLRWKHPTRGLVGPGEFVPILEQTGMIVAFGEWVLESACRQAMQWPGAMRVAVNVSPVQFSRSDLVLTVQNCLAQSGLEPERLELEITESLIIEDLDRAIDTLRQLKAMGVRVAMDDFGTGYSSLATLQAFPFDNLKIDRSVTCNLDTNEEAATILRAVIGLAKNLRIPVLAEGVENRGQLDFLRTEGCDEAQGFGIGKPMPAADIAGFVLRNAPRLRIQANDNPIAAAG